MINTKILEVDKDFLSHNGVSKELFNFDNIRYYEELNPVKGDSIHNAKYVKIVFNKYLPDGCELKVNEIGLQPGENRHEIITSEGLDSSKSERFTINEIMEVI